MSLDPNIAGFLAALRSAGAPAGFAGTPGERRERMRAAIEDHWDPAAFAPVGGVEEVRVGHLPLLLVRPAGRTGPVPTVLYFHPGGFTMGSAHLMRDVAHRLAHDLNACVVSVDYRLAPEHPFPAAVEDAERALRWAAEFVDDLGGDARRIGLAGESSGANLAAVTAIAARDAGIPVAGQLLASPVTDFTACYPSEARNGEGLFLTRADLAVIRRGYLADDDARAADPRASPALAADLAGVAPAVVGVAGFDPLCDDGIVYAAELLRAGVPTALRVYPGLIHPFFGMPGLAPAADAAVAELTAEFAALLVAPGAEDRS
ncbi:alpha/beta hydrolase [Actinosynnema sp. NPDC047251]|uniref:Esterase/lipase/thioesterase n=1 Tax=Saccharothrix espanaensis (strain ATCC 51144 / DSM 44229 / JCM 9112 / NBRC 15066 / NRRL 15764) TaxID=1179773 RepID=K0K508_SACES|nr:alpha/beta hydrolase [Saccharothrix espanaensis]CCH31959.1 Esterase/lipase/thioesterase [Saccharothrix espanaensis DSM 44229]